MNKHFCLASLLASLNLFACSDEPLSATVDTSDATSFCRAAAETQCATMYGCLTPQEMRALDLPATEAECQRQFEENCEDGAARCDTETHRLSSASAAECLDQLDVAVCNDAAEPWLDAPACNELCERTAGAFQLQWQFSSYYSCYDVNAESIALVATGPGNKTFKEVFPCTIGYGFTDALPIGDYNVHVEVLNANGVTLWASPTQSGKLDKAVVDLGTIVIPVGN